MDRAITITLIVCLTLILISVLQSVNKAQERKYINKRLDKFKRAFKDLDKKQNDDDDDLPKFGGF